MRSFLNKTLTRKPNSTVRTWTELWDYYDSDFTTTENTARILQS